MICYFDDMLVIGILTVLFIIFVIYLRAVRKKCYMYLLCFAVMYVYLCIVINITQFPIYASDGMREAMGGQNVWREMNLIPFKEMISGFSSEVLLNILMTIPLGFGLPFLIHCSWRRITFSGILTGALCETGQLLTALWAGFTFRHVNIDDVILNMIGTLSGYALFKGFKIIFKLSMDRWDLKTNGFFKYIDDVCDESRGR